MTFLTGIAIQFALAHGTEPEPYRGSRIFWDVATETTALKNAIYSRITELQDGSLLACAESDGIVVARSFDKGRSWSAPDKIARRPDRVGLCVPDIIQLSDGTIIVGYNPRPSRPWSEERKFGIMAVRSIDNGHTWSDPITIFTASHRGGEGCWEPSFLELPSGELQCYFANEYEFPESDEQCISVSRSFDKGITWSEPERVSFRTGHRDGMPAPVLLNGTNEIVVIIEDNGWGHKSFVATTVRCQLDVNWHSYHVGTDDANRQQIFQATPSRELISAAPYLAVLPSGETIASYMGNEGRPRDDDEYRDMFVEVGDARAMNFKGRTRPFNLDDRHRSLWNSVAVIDGGKVMAIGSVGEIGKGTSIRIIKGTPRDGIDIPYSASITPDGTMGDEEKWWDSAGEQFAMGVNSRNRSTIDFAYDDSNLYFIAAVTDKSIAFDENGADGVRILIDANNVCDTQPDEGLYDFQFMANGQVIGHQGVSNRRAIMNDVAIARARCAVKTDSNGYIMEGAIPWTSIGLDARPRLATLRMAFEIADYDGSNTTTETIPDAMPSQPWTWMEVRWHDER